MIGTRINETPFQDNLDIEAYVYPAYDPTVLNTNGVCCTPSRCNTKA